jgi:hypothetical protein
VGGGESELGVEVRDDGGSGSEDSFGFDFDGPEGVEQSGDDHGGGGTDGAEGFAVGAAYGFPVLGAGEKDAGADDVGEGGPGLGEGSFDELEDVAGLVGRGEIFSADGAGAGDVDGIADANGAGETDDGLVGAGAGDVGAGVGAGRVGHDCIR